MNLNMYVNGEWHYRTAQSLSDVVNPANGKVIAHMMNGSVSDAEKAIKSARNAFDNGAWANTTTQERSQVLHEIADKIENNINVLAELETKDNGKPIREAEIDVQDAVNCFRYYAAIVRNPIGKKYQLSGSLDTLIHYEPIGVCGLIVPWNYPLLMGVWKLAAALAAGNSIVFKPSEVTPVTAVKLFEIFDSVSLPQGVVNLVLGDGAVVGNEIAESEEVDMVSFTGGTVTGKKIMQAATSNLKKVSLELGGKSPNVIFADTNIDLAVDFALYGIYYGAGQVCSAASRLLVEDDIFDEFVEKFAERAKKIVVGPGDDVNSEMGPLVSKEHLNKVLDYIEIGKQEGATLLCGGERLTDEEFAQGYFVTPTAFINVEQHMRIVQEEIFGPVVTIQKFTDEKEAIALANGTRYGLAGGVFTDDRTKAIRVIKQIRSGITWINSFHESYDEAPWGGYKESGIGHSLGEEGLHEFLNVKQINVENQPEKIQWFTNE